MKNILRVITLLVVSSPVVVLAGEPILNLSNIPVPIKADGSAHTVEEVRAAIIQGCKAKGWTPTLPDPSKVVASILVRSKHYAEVEIPFTASGYSIKYRSSRDLDYDEKDEEIHRNYNKWVANLSQYIQREFASIR